MSDDIATAHDTDPKGVATSDDLAAARDIDPKGVATSGAPQTSPPQLTEAYHNARAHYALAAGLLLSWDLVGLTIEPSQEVAGVKIQMAAPQAAPFAILAVMLYCSVRTAIEWYQCDRARRRLRWPLIDATLSNALGLAALSLFAFQRVSNISVGQYLVAPVGIRLFLSACTGAFIGFSAGKLRGLSKYWIDPKDVPGVKRFNAIGFLLGSVITSVLLRSLSPYYWLIPALSALPGYGMGLFVADWMSSLEVAWNKREALGRDVPLSEVLKVVKEEDPSGQRGGSGT